MSIHVWITQVQRPRRPTRLHQFGKRQLLQLLLLLKRKLLLIQWDQDELHPGRNLIILMTEVQGILRAFIWAIAFELTTYLLLFIILNLVVFASKWYSYCSSAAFCSDSILKHASADLRKMGQRIFVFIIGGATRSEVKSPLVFMLIPCCIFNLPETKFFVDVAGQLRSCYKLTAKLRREVVLGSTSFDDPQEYVSVTNAYSSNFFFFHFRDCRWFLFLILQKLKQVSGGEI